MPLSVTPGSRQNFSWLAGHSADIDNEGKHGPYRQFTAAVVGKCLGRWDARGGRLFRNKMGAILRAYLDNAGFQHYDDLYYTSLLKTPALRPGKWSNKWVKEQEPLFRAELIAARPKFVLAFGLELVKYFFGNKAKLSTCEGRWLEVVWDLRPVPEMVGQTELEPPTDENTYRFWVLPCINPAALEFEQTDADVARLESSLKSFVSTVNLYKSGEKDFLRAQNMVSLPDYAVVRTAQELEQLIDTMQRECSHGVIGVDAEWQGSHPANRNAWIRCFQVAWAEGRAATIQLSDEEGNFAFVGHDGQADLKARQWLVEEVKAAFARNAWRVAGFYYGADHEWLAYIGLDLEPYFTVAETPEKCKTEGGLLVDLMLGAYDELAGRDLEAVRVRFTDVPDYYAEFDKWRVAQIAASKDPRQIALMKDGFGWIPGDNLYPYAAADADVTLRAAIKFCSLLDADKFGNSCWRPYWLAARAAPVAYEIMRTGMPFSLQECARLSIAYSKQYSLMRNQLRQSLRWPGFSVDSRFHKAEVLYGARYSVKRDKSGNRVSCRPDGAKTFAFEPIIDSDPDSPKLWTEVRAAGQEAINDPSVAAKVMGMMINSADGIAARRAMPGLGFTEVLVPPPQELKLLRDTITVSKIVGNFVGRVTQKGDGGFKFEGGLGQHVCDDGYLRCAVFQNKETGRWSTAMPSLHTFPKKRESRYKEIVGKENYPGKIRSMIQAPEGYLICESDYASAELFMLSMASGDQVLWDHCQRNLLDESDPRFIDPHASLCVRGFHLKCEPNKTGLASIGMPFMREVAKCVAEGEYVNTSLGLVRVELLGQGLAEGDVATPRHVKGLQSINGQTKFVAIQNTGVMECVDIHTSLGCSIKTSLEHKHLVITNDGLCDFLEAGLIEPGMQLLLASSSLAGEGTGFLPREVDELLEAVADETVFLDDRSEDISEDGALMLGVLAGSQDSAESDHGIRRLKLGHVGRQSRDAIVKLLQDMFSPSSAGGDLLDERVLYLSGPAASLLDRMKKSEWGLIPDFVLQWPTNLRAAYLYGVSLVKLRGYRQGAAVSLPGKLAKKMQLAMHSVGLLVNLSNFRSSGFSGTKGVTDGTYSLVPFCEATRAFNRYLYDGSFRWHQVSSLVGSSEVQVRGVARRCLRLAKETGICLTDDGSTVSSFSVSKGYTIELLYRTLQSCNLSQRELLSVSRLLNCLESNFIPVVVTGSSPAGRQKTYDIETSAEQEHVLLVNGLATHNSVIYGWAYGRGAAAIQLGAKEEGITVTLKEVEALLQALEDTYSDAAAFLVEAGRRVEDGYLFTPLGRIRRCPYSTDRRKLSGYGREFKNSPIQGGVADVVNIAAYNLRRERERRGMKFHFIMQIHDAFLYLVRYDEVYELCNEVIPKAMVEDIPIVPYQLDGSPTYMVEPKYMGINIDLSFCWGESMSKEEKRHRLLEVGVDADRITRLE